MCSDVELRPLLPPGGFEPCRDRSSVLQSLIHRLQKRLGNGLKEVWLFGSRDRMTDFAPDRRNAENIKLQAEERLGAAKKNSFGWGSIMML